MVALLFSLKFESSGAAILAVETTDILATLRDEEFAVALVRVDDPRTDGRVVPVRALDAELDIRVELKTRGMDRIVAVVAVAHGDHPIKSGWVLSSTFEQSRI
jgi:hypothetical protein